MSENISLEIPYDMNKYADIVENTWIKNCRYVEDFIQKPSSSYVSKESMTNIIINYFSTISKKDEVIEVKYYNVNNRNHKNTDFILTFGLKLSEDIKTPFRTVEKVKTEFSEYGNNYNLKNPIFTTFALFPARRSYVLVDDYNSNQVMTKIAYDEMSKTVFVESRYDNSLNRENHNFEFGIVVDENIINTGELVRKKCSNHKGVEYNTESVIFD